MITSLAVASIVGLILGLRFRAAMLLLSSMLVLLAGCATEWTALMSSDESFWAMMRIWLVLATHQMAFVAGSCEALVQPRRVPGSAEIPADRPLLDYGSRGRLPGG